jgi:hypothetical protein
MLTQAAAALKAKRQAVAATAGLLKTTSTTDNDDSEQQQQSEEEESTSVLVVAPGMASHPDFQQSFFDPSCAVPLAKLSGLSGSGSTALVAECWCGGGLEFPVILLSASNAIAAIPEPEGGYKIYTTAGGEVSAEEYIAGMCYIVYVTVYAVKSCML